MTTRHFTLLMIILFLLVIVSACDSPIANPVTTSVSSTTQSLVNTRVPTVTPTPVPPTATLLPPAEPPVPDPTPKDTFQLPKAMFPAKGVIEVGEFTSAALADNLLGDSVTRKYWVYLPPDYDETDKQYPVVYVLHHYDSYAGGWMQEMASDLDGMIAAGEVPEMILVSPDAHNVFGGSWYMSSPTIGDYETYITQELVEIIDTDYRTIPQRESRGITGCEMGGSGAMHLALIYPDIFSVVSGVGASYDFASEPDWERALNEYKGEPASLADLEDYPISIYLARAAATSPNPDKPPFYFDMPFEIRDGKAQIVPAVAEEINAADSLHDLDEYLQQPTRLNGLMIYAVAADTYFPVEAVRDFSKKLTANDVKHEYVETNTPPTHPCPVSSNPAVLQFMSTHLAHERPRSDQETTSPATLLDYVDHDGVKIHYEIEGEGPPLVLVHGGSGNTRDWDLFGYTDALEDNYQLIMVDLRGHGQSDKPHDASAYDPETQAGDIIAVLDELGIDKTHYFGYSLGGALGWALAKHAPERFNSMIINGDEPAGYDDSELAGMMVEMGPEAWAQMVEDVARANGISQPGIYEAYAGNDMEALALAFVELSWMDATDILPNIDIPMLLIQGTNDAELEAMTEASEVLPNAELVLLDGLDHAQGFFLSDQVLPHITAFLEEVGAETETPASRLDEVTVTEIEKLVEEMMADSQVPGMAIGVIQDGELVYANGFGVTSLEDGEAITPQTLFQQAEGTMAPTTMAVLQLVEAGKIDLDAPLTEYLPYFKLKDERYKDITVGHILASQSGIPDSGDYMADWESFQPMYDAGATERWVRTLTDTGMLFAPGEGFEYSDMAYAILGDVIAKASGQSYEEYIDEKIFEPLGMEASSLLLEDIDQSMLASPHILGEVDDMVVAKLPYHRPFAAANNMFTSVEDMAKLAQVSLGHGELEGDRILATDTFDTMWEAHATTPFGSFPFGRVYPSMMMVNWGYGWFIGDVLGHPAYTTFGREHGYHAGMVVIPDENLAVIAMGNGPVTDSYYAHDTAVDVLGTLLDQ